jgi:transcriptional regulator with XRE-family HTH domain
LASPVTTILFFQRTFFSEKGGSKMSKRSQQKLISNPNKTLKFLRERSLLSMRKVARITGLSTSIINHLENGRLDIKDHHLERLLPIYGVSHDIYMLFVTGKNALPQNLEADCIRIIKGMTVDELQTAINVLGSLSTRRKRGS